MLVFFVVITNCHKLIDLKQHTFILHSIDWKSDTRLSGLKSRYQQGDYFWEALEENSFPHLFQLLPPFLGSQPPFTTLKARNIGSLWSSLTNPVSLWPQDSLLLLTQEIRFDPPGILDNLNVHLNLHLYGTISISLTYSYLPSLFGRVR